jgi:hypothetical protein
VSWIRNSIISHCFFTTIFCIFTTNRNNSSIYAYVHILVPSLKLSDLKSTAINNICHNIFKYKPSILTRVKWIFKMWSLEVTRFYIFADVYQLYGGSFTSIHLRCNFSSKDAGSSSSKKLVSTFDTAFYYTAGCDSLMFESCESLSHHTIKEQLLRLI